MVEEHVLNRGLLVSGTGPGAGAPIGESSLVAVTLTSVTVDTTDFVSRDIGGRREGLVQLTVGDQETVLEFRGEGAIEVDCSGRIAFLGANPGFLGFRCRVLELDRKARRILGTAGAVADMIAGVPGAWTTGAAKAGLNGAADLYRLIRRRIRDETEVAAFWVADGPLCDGQVLDVRLPDSERPRVSLKMTVRDLGTRNTHRRFAVRIREPRLSFVRNADAPGGRKAAADRGQSVGHWWHDATGLERLRLLNFEASSGRRRVRESFRLHGIDVSLCWDCHELFRITATRASGGHVLPVALAFSLHSEPFPAEELEDLFGHAVALGRELDDDMTGSEAVTLRKQGECAIGMMSRMLEGEAVLFSFDGLLLLLPDGEGKSTPWNGKIALGPDGSRPGVWSAVVRREWTGAGSACGTFAFTLEVTEEP